MCVRTLVIANTAEFNRRGMPDEGLDAWYDAWHNAGADLADIALFCCGDDKLVITPYPMNEEFVADVREVLGYRNTQILSPTRNTDSICEDIVLDSELFAFLVDTLRCSRHPEIITWGATRQLYTLLDHFRQAGVALRAPEVPVPDNYWTALYLDSKAGFREFCRKLRAQLPDLRLPEGFILSNKHQAVEAAAYFFFQRRGLVLKANYGTGGTSVLCYDNRQLHRGLGWLRRDALRRMSLDNYWDSPLVVLEEYIGGSEDAAPLAPTVDLLISENGQVALKGMGSMLMRSHHVYAGVQCGLGSLEPPIANSLVQIGYVVGNAMSNLGYRGWFDIDFVVGKDRQVYLTEINARRASPCHVFEIGNRLQGQKWSSKCGLYANDHLRLQGSCHPAYSTIRPVFTKFNRSQGTHMAIAIPTIASSSLSRRTPYLGYVIVARNAHEAAELAARFEDMIREAVGMSGQEACVLGSGSV